MHDPGSGSTTSSIEYMPAAASSSLTTCTAARCPVVRLSDVSATTATSSPALPASQGRPPTHRTTACFVSVSFVLISISMSLPTGSNRVCNEGLHVLQGSRCQPMSGLQSSATSIIHWKAESSGLTVQDAKAESALQATPRVSACTGRTARRLRPVPGAGKEHLEDRACRVQRQRRHRRRSPRG